MPRTTSRHKVSTAYQNTRKLIALLRARYKRTGVGLASPRGTAVKGNSELPSVKLSTIAKVRSAAGRSGDELSTTRGQPLLAEPKLHTVVDVFDVGVILIGPDGALKHINHYASELLVGDRSEYLIACLGELHTRLREATDKLSKTGAASTMAHIEIAGATGVSRRLCVELHALRPADVKGYLLIIKDRDLIDALDEDLRAATRAHSLSRLYAAAAHDLKAPLNAMSLHLEMLRRSLSTVDAKASRPQAHSIEILSQELARLNRLLHTILEQGAPAAEDRGFIDLKLLIDELGTLLTPQARHQRVMLLVDLPLEPVAVFGNAAQLKQALLNVMLNALECVTEGGKVDISVHTDAAAALVTVRDDGPGISPNLRAHIFDMHFTTKNTGTGIGLYVARAVAESHGGVISVESTLGVGTCFRISLPLQTVKHGADPVAAAHSGSV